MAKHIVLKNRPEMPDKIKRRSKRVVTKLQKSKNVCEVKPMNIVLKPQISNSNDSDTFMDEVRNTGRKLNKLLKLDAEKINKSIRSYRDKCE